MKATIAVLGDTAISKVNQLHTSKSRYLTLTMMAGFFVGFGIILIFTIGGLLDQLALQERKLLWALHLGLR